MNSLIVLLIGSLFLQVPAPALAVRTPVFPDMEHSWYRYAEAVSELRDDGVIDGYPDGTFKPRQTINRAEFLKLVFAAKGADHAATGSCFSDVPEDAWFAPFVCAAVRRDIAKGYPDGTFKPEQDVNWAEALALLVRAYGWDVEERSGEKWYTPIVYELDRKDVLRASSYIPWEPLTRERAADLLYRMLEIEHGRTLRKSEGCSDRKGGVETTITVNGIERSFILDVPSSAERGEPTPLLVVFHGRTNSNEQVHDYMGFDKAAEDYVVAYPAALRNTPTSFSWADPGDKAQEIRDIAFFDAIVEHLANSLCIDMDRIYTAGHSLGAWMANTVACVRGGVVRASGTVGGDSVFTDCNGPSAAFIAHNPDDNLASFAGAERLRELRVGENTCSWDTIETQPRSFLCVKHTGCTNGNDIYWCPHEIDTDHRGSYYPHVWPPRIGQAIVDFFDELDE